MGLNLIKEARQVLHVVDPSESVRALELLVISEGSPVREEVGQSNDISYSD